MRRRTKSLSVNTATSSATGSYLRGAVVQEEACIWHRGVEGKSSRQCSAHVVGVEERRQATGRVATEHDSGGVGEAARGHKAGEVGVEDAFATEIDGRDLGTVDHDWVWVVPRERGTVAVVPGPIIETCDFIGLNNIRNVLRYLCMEEHTWEPKLNSLKRSVGVECEVWVWSAKCGCGVRSVAGKRRRAGSGGKVGPTGRERLQGRANGQGEIAKWGLR